MHKTINLYTKHLNIKQCHFNGYITQHSFDFLIYNLLLLKFNRLKYIIFANRINFKNNLYFLYMNYIYHLF